MENKTFKGYFPENSRTAIRTNAPPGGVTHFNISDSGYGNRNIYHPHKRNNHPNNDINPPPNAPKKEEVIDPNIPTPVTGKRPSIRPRAPPGGFTSFNLFGEVPNAAESSNNEDKSSTHEAMTSTQTGTDDNSSQTKPITSFNNNKYNNNISIKKDVINETLNSPRKTTTTITSTTTSTVTSANSSTQTSPELKPTIPELEKVPEIVAAGTTTATDELMSDSISGENHYHPAPPGGKSSFSFNYGATSQEPSPYGKRRNYGNSHFTSSITFG